MSRGAKKEPPSYLELVAKLERLGNIVKEFRVNGVVEFHAIPRNGRAPHIARCKDGDSDEHAYKAIDMLLWAMVFHLEDD